MKKLIAKENYLLKNYAKIGHGNYIIGSGTTTYSHSDENYNAHASKSFKLCVDDTIFMEFDSDKRILRLRKNRSEKKFQFDIVEPENDSYHPSVCLVGVGASLTLVNGELLS